MKKSFLIIWILLIYGHQTFGQNSPLYIYGSGLDGSTYQTTAIYSDTYYGLLIEAPLSSNINKLPIQFNWRGGGVPPLFINSDSQVGIGTATPLSKLEVRSSFNTESMTLGSASGGALSVTSANGFYGLYTGVGNSGNVWMQVGRNDGNTTAYDLILQPNGRNVGIGTTTPDSRYKLDVCGVIRAKEIKVDLEGGCDFVFKNNYKLMDLKELEQFVKANQHLPEIAPENEMVENGVNMKEMQMKLLQKIEELTLYTIEQNKKLEQQNQEIIELKKQNEKIEELRQLMISQNEKIARLEKP